MRTSPLTLTEGINACIDEDEIGAAGLVTRATGALARADGTERAAALGDELARLPVAGVDLVAVVVADAGVFLELELEGEQEAAGVVEAV